MNRWKVTYTNHLKQKRKVYHDGFLDIHRSSNKVSISFTLLLHYTSFNRTCRYVIMEKNMSNFGGLEQESMALTSIGGDRSQNWIQSFRIVEM